MTKNSKTHIRKKSFKISSSGANMDKGLFFNEKKRSLQENRNSIKLSADRTANNIISLNRSQERDSILYMANRIQEDIEHHWPGRSHEKEMPTSKWPKRVLKHARGLSTDNGRTEDFYRPVYFNYKTIDTPAEETLSKKDQFPKKPQNLVSNIDDMSSTVKNVDQTTNLISALDKVEDCRKISCKPYFKQEVNEIDNKKEFSSTRGPSVDGRRWAKNRFKKLEYAVKQLHYNERIVSRRDKSVEGPLVDVFRMKTRPLILKYGGKPKQSVSENKSEDRSQDREHLREKLQRNFPYNSISISKMDTLSPHQKNTQPLSLFTKPPVQPREILSNRQLISRQNPPIKSVHTKHKSFRLSDLDFTHQQTSSNFFKSSQTRAKNNEGKFEGLDLESEVMDDFRRLQAKLD